MVFDFTQAEAHRSGRYFDLWDDPKRLDQRIAELDREVASRAIGDPNRQAQGRPIGPMGSQSGYAKTPE